MHISLGKMAQYYEIVVKLPNDISTQVPGILESSVDVLTSQKCELPSLSYWDLTLVPKAVVSLASCLVRVIIAFWQCINPIAACPYFIQLEKGKEWHHLHILLSDAACDSLVLGRYTNKLRHRLVDAVYDGIEPEIPDWFCVHKTRLGGKNKKVGEDYIFRYLLSKVQPDVLWCWTDLHHLQPLVLDNRCRQELMVKADRAATESESTDQSEAADRAPVISGVGAANYSRLVEWLVEQGITSEKQWLETDKNSYRSFHANANSSRQIRAALENARVEMLLLKSAGDYLIGETWPSDIESNKVYKLFTLNRYDPALVGGILLRWCQKLWGKRNTIWLTGPASTGKTNLAEAIAHAVPIYGCVNWTNENFPFNDCTDKMIIWWEEGKMTAKLVEPAKAILGGSKVRVDQKCKQSVQIEPTPVIITSNIDMTLVIDGNSITREHEEPLQHRMWKIVLDSVLPPTWGKITSAEVKSFLAWASDQNEIVQPVFEVPRVQTPVHEQVMVDLTLPELDSVPCNRDSSIPPLEEPVIVPCATPPAVRPSTPLPSPRYVRSVTYVCLEHDRGDCDQCSEEEICFTQTDWLQCDERMSTISEESGIEPLLTPTPSPPSFELYGWSPITLHEAFDVDFPDAEE